MNTSEKKLVINALDELEEVLSAFERAMYPSSYEVRLASHLENSRKYLKQLLGE